MAETTRMTAEEVVSRLMIDEPVDFVRESLRWVVEQLSHGRFLAGTPLSHLIGPKSTQRGCANGIGDSPPSPRRAAAV